MLLRMLFIVMTIGLISSCISAPESFDNKPLTPLEEKGLKIFQREPCYSACHVTTLATPASSTIANTTGFAPDLRKTQRHTRDWYLAYFVDPRSVLPYSFMPSFAHLPRGDIDALIAFLQRLNRRVKIVQPEPVASKDIPRVPRTPETYRAGQAVFNTYCAGCHGTMGNGGGAAGHMLSPEPRDFTDGTWMSKQSENYLFAVVTVGKPNTAMPAFKDILTPAQRALALRYIAYFADPVARARVEVGLNAPGER